MNFGVLLPHTRTRLIWPNRATRIQSSRVFDRVTRKQHVSSLIRLQLYYSAVLLPIEEKHPRSDKPFCKLYESYGHNSKSFISKTLTFPKKKKKSKFLTPNSI